MKTSGLQRTAVLFLALLPAITQAQEDAHDELVYSRYSRFFQSTAFKERNRRRGVQLDRPATQEDVKAGRAIFSFEGLGEARVCELPNDTSSVWRGRRDIRCPSSEYVRQAEELKVGERWKRYYGVLSFEGAAVVPADEWETYWPDAPWIPGYLKLIPRRLTDSPFGTSGGNPFGHPVEDRRCLRVTLSQPKPNRWIREIDDPLVVTVRFTNDLPFPKKVPSTWAGTAANGKPAMVDDVSLSLEWIPYDPDNPEISESTPVRREQIPSMKRDTSIRSLKPDEDCVLFSFDLHDWFEIEKKGYYKLEVRIGGDVLELVYQEIVCSCEFTIGKPPKRPTLEEYNATLPIFGSPEDEQRLRRLIHETVKPAPVEHESLSPEAKSLFAWSEPVAGLSARIENICDHRIWWGGDCFVRLKNVSSQPLTVPMGNPSAEGAMPLFDLYVQHGAGPWRCVKGQNDGYIAAPSDPNVCLLDLPVEDRPWVTLLPGEDCVAVFQAWNEEDCVVASRAKVVLRLPDTPVAERWSGVIETPPYDLDRSGEQYNTNSVCRSFPDHFPLFKHNYTGYSGEPFPSSSVESLQFWNTAIIATLGLYDSASVREETEQRMQAASKRSMKLLLAAIAASEGSEEAALLLMEQMRQTEMWCMRDTQCALSIVCDRMGAREPPDWQPKELPPWLVELCLVMLTDDRTIPDLGETVESMATDLDREFCYAQPRSAVPKVIQWIEKGRTDMIEMLGDIGGEQAINALAGMTRDERMKGPAVEALCDSGDRLAVPPLLDVLQDDGPPWSKVIMALCWIGDKRAVPVLMGLLEKIDESDIQVKDGELQPPLLVLAETLSHLKAKEAVSPLLRFVEYPEIIRCLGEIGDPAARPVVQQIVNARGRFVREGSAVSPERDDARYFAARMAMCAWDEDGGAARLLKMLSEEETVAEHRDEIVSALGASRHPSTIPALVAVIKSAEGRDSIRSAISALGEMKHKAAVEGLIESLDVDFQEKYWSKVERITPSTYRNLIAQSLQNATGRSFGNDKNQWRQWWQQEGRHSTDLK